MHAAVYVHACTFTCACISYCTLAAWSRLHRLYSIAGASLHARALPLPARLAIDAVTARAEGRTPARAVQQPGGDGGAAGSGVAAVSPSLTEGFASDAVPQGLPDAFVNRVLSCPP